MLESSGSVDFTFVSVLVGALADRSFFPAVTAVAAGADGSIWVRREETGAESVPWQVFTHEGVLHGTLTTPRGFELVRATVDEVWGVEENELAVPFLLRMRVVG